MSRRRSSGDMAGPRKWDAWLRSFDRNPDPRVQLPGSMAMLTGQDKRALAAIAACWELYACSDDDGARGALQAVRALLPALQPKCRGFARELIPWAMDWSDKDRVWRAVLQGDDPDELH